MTRWSRKTCLVLSCLGLLASLLSVLVGQVHAEIKTTQRSAVVIGNANYSSAPLRNPINDARAIEGVLRELGFEVSVIEDAATERLQAALDQAADLFTPGGIGLFYYAGHAVQHHGKNYLLPVDFRANGAGELPARSIAASSVLEVMQQAGVGISILILDACRNYPFGEGSEALGHGLTSMPASGETLVAYATAAGAVAEDGIGPNSPYTSAFDFCLGGPWQGHL